VAVVATHFETPSTEEINACGQGWIIRFGVASTPFGQCLMAQCPRGFCHISFVDDVAISGGLKALRARWSQAQFCSDDTAASEWSARVFCHPEHASLGEPHRVCVIGTSFQRVVWDALTRIPFGVLTTYGELARSIGHPNASRAVGTAIGSNEVAWLIPCHRVIRGDGALGGYRWGADRKRMLIDWERGVIAARD
jgi:AraC family transcriptional regulator of adaptative response/methylated-DNA-[protein]-cysteine methyltransferase